MDYRTLSLMETGSDTV